MSKLSIISLFLLSICILMSNLSSVESDRNDSESARHRIQKRIVGGHYTNKYKDTVFRLQLDSHFCVGTFIAPNAILTAAHCCVNVKSNTVLVSYESVSYESVSYESDTHKSVSHKSGSHVSVSYNSGYHVSVSSNGINGNTHIVNNVVNANSRSYRLAVRKYHINPDYKFGISKDDIAVIELTYRFSGVIPATLEYYRQVKFGETVWMYGYGRTKLNQNVGAVMLSSKVSKSLSREDMIYTCTKNGSMCFDDAGGPMFNQYGAIVGVHSGGGKNCSVGGENYAVRVSSHERFIQRALRQKSASDRFQKPSVIYIKAASSTSNLNSLIMFFSMIAFYTIY